MRSGGGTSYAARRGTIMADCTRTDVPSVPRLPIELRNVPHERWHLNITKQLRIAIPVKTDCIDWMVTILI